MEKTQKFICLKKLPLKKTLSELKMATIYCKECNTEFRHCAKASEMYNKFNILKKDFFQCKCGKVIDETKNPLGTAFK